MSNLKSLFLVILIFSTLLINFTCVHHHKFDVVNGVFDTLFVDSSDVSKMGVTKFNGEMVYYHLNKGIEKNSGANVNVILANVKLNKIENKETPIQNDETNKVVVSIVPETALTEKNGVLSLRCKVTGKYGCSPLMAINQNYPPESNGMVLFPIIVFVHHPNTTLATYIKFADTTAFQTFVTNVNQMYNQNNGCANIGFSNPPDNDDGTYTLFNLYTE